MHANTHAATRTVANAGVEWLASVVFDLHLHATTLQRIASVRLVALRRHKPFKRNIFNFKQSFQASSRTSCKRDMASVAWLEYEPPALLAA